MKTADGTALTALEIDSSDTSVIYVDTDNTAKAEGGSIQLADEPTTGNYTMNVFVVRDAGVATGTTLDAIFVDVNNKMENVTYGASVNTSADVLTPAAGTTTYTLTRDGSTNVKEDATITLKVTSGVAAVPAGGQVVTVKCNETGETKTVTFDAAAAAGTVKTITFAQKAYATTYSLVKGAAADTLA